MSSGQPDPRIFVSYSNIDKEFAMRLVADLRKVLGSDDAVWFDQSGGLSGGESFRRRIESEINSRSVFIVIMSPDSMDSGWVEWETDIALVRRNTHRAMTVIPVLYRACDVPSGLNVLQTISFVAPISYEESLEALCTALKVAPPTRQTPLFPPIGTSPSPDVFSNAAVEPRATRVSRSLPLYLLLDCSTSMQGAPIQAIREGVRMLYDQLVMDPETRSRVKISVITFSDSAEQSDLVPISSFVPPWLGLAAGGVVIRSLHAAGHAAGGVTRLDGALNLLAHSIEADLRPTSPTARGDYPPVVFLITDGAPTDESGYPSKLYQREMSKIRSFRANQKPLIVALGYGPHADITVLKDITNNVLFLADVSGEKLREYFSFISGSVRSSSPLAERVVLLPVPPGFTFVM